MGCEERGVRRRRRGREVRLGAFEFFEEGEFERVAISHVSE